MNSTSPISPELPFGLCKSEERRLLCGFTRDELFHLGAFTNNQGSIVKNNLQGIHEAFAQEKWEKETSDLPKYFERKQFYRRREDHSRWTGHNPRVWEALEPSLRLASKFLENAHIFPWVSFPRCNVQFEYYRLRD